MHLKIRPFEAVASIKKEGEEECGDKIVLSALIVEIQYFQNNSLNKQLGLI